MGYDMYFRGKCGSAADEVYFRLNISGMRWARGEMAARGMIFDAGAYPPFPDVRWDLMDRYRYPDEYPDAPLSDAEVELAKAAVAASDEHLSWHGPEIPGIPEHKFCSNDGWIVTPAECQAAVRLARQSSPPADYADMWWHWVDYMDRASRAEGFEVW